MNPVRTREDCFDWLTLEEVEQEVFGAFVGAQQHTRNFDFAAFHAEASRNDPAYVMQPGTVLFTDGAPAWGRGQFLEYLAAGIVWRLQALAKRKGVDLADFDPAGLLNSPAFRDKGFGAPYFAYLGGEVRTLGDEAFKALPLAQQRALKASARSGRPVSVKGALRDV